MATAIAVRGRRMRLALRFCCSSVLSAGSFVENVRAYIAPYDTMSAAQADNVWTTLTGEAKETLNQGL